MTASLLVIVLEGADGRLLDTASTDGSLPNLTALRQRGHGWRLQGVPGSTDDALWASFQYGADLGEHGRYSVILQDDRGQRRLAIDDERDREAFWVDLSRQGRRVAVLDIPKVARTTPINGIHLADWLVHGRYHQTPISYPAALAGDITAQFGPAPPSRCGYTHKEGSDDAKLAAMAGHMLQSVQQKRGAGLHFLAAEHWDLFLLGFKESHCSSHMLWDLHDPASPGYDAARTERLGDPVWDVLLAQDDAVGAVVAQAGADCDVVVFTTSDFEPNGTMSHLMIELEHRVSHYLGHHLERRPYPWLRAKLGRPIPYCRAVRCSDDFGTLRVLRQRGDTDASFRARVDLITDLVCELVDPADGLPVVRSAAHPAFERPGSRAHMLPHIVFYYRRNICPTTVHSDRLGTLSGKPPLMRPGNHEPGGFAIAAGPSADIAAREVHTMADFAGFAGAALSRAAAFA